MMLLAVFIGGGLGAAFRHGLSAAMGPAGSPWSILAVNLLGALGIGLIAGIGAHVFSLPPLARGFLVTGILGGFTTFSAFSLDAALMIQRGDYLMCGLYVAASVIGTVAIVLGTMALVRVVA